MQESWRKTCQAAFFVIDLELEFNDSRPTREMVSRDTGIPHVNVNSQFKQNFNDCTLETALNKQFYWKSNKHASFFVQIILSFFNLILTKVIIGLPVLCPTIQSRQDQNFNMAGKVQDEVCNPFGGVYS